MSAIRGQNMRWKTICGIIMILGSLLLLTFWEIKGREIILMTPVIAASHDIILGTTLTKEDFMEIRVSPENILVGALMSKDIESLTGLISNCEIYANQQLLPSYFKKENLKISKEQSIFVLPELWIYSRSSAIRAGDKIALYNLPNSEKIGVFIVAFVKDDNEQEVKDLVENNIDILDRTQATSEISHIEIICTLAEYLSIYNKVVDSGYGNLLIIMEDIG